MNGLELSEKYYEEYGRPMLEQDFSAFLPYIAVGYVGSGSERFGFDDEISQDHDFEPGFCIFLPSEDEVDRKTAFQMERAYAKLPKEFCGVRRQPISPVGGNRNGVLRMEEFYQATAGLSGGALSVEQWLTVPEHALAEATNGKVFFDGSGEFSRIREYLNKMPEDIRKKRLAGNLLIMAQSGQYNFLRCIRHGEKEAAQLACYEFVRATLKAVFLLHRKYIPYYKWSFRALRRTCDETELADLLGRLLADGNPEEKQDNIEIVAGKIIAMLQAQNITKAICGDLEKHAYSVNDEITDGYVRNLHILSAVL